MSSMNHQVSALILYQLEKISLFHLPYSSLLSAIALLSLISAEKEKYYELVHSLISKQSEVTVRDRLAQSFNILMSNNDVNIGLDKLNRRAFCKNFKSFVASVRGFMRIK